MQAFTSDGANALDLSSNRLSLEVVRKLPSKVGERLLLLDLSRNELRQLSHTSMSGGSSGGHAFANLTHLRHLILSGNRVKTLFAGVFRGLKRLESLVMRDGQLRYMDEHAFDGLENLRLLDLEDNEIASIYLELFQSILNLHVSRHVSSSLLLPFSCCCCC